MVEILLSGALSVFLALGWAEIAQEVIDRKGERVIGGLRLEHAHGGDGIAVLLGAESGPEGAALGLVVEILDLVLLTSDLGGLAGRVIFADTRAIERAG